jgi:superfamily I DNA and/or RNA helicase
MYNLERSKESEEATYFKKLKSLTENIYNQKQLQELSKLVPEKPFKETLFDHISREKQKYLGEGKVKLGTVLKVIEKVSPFMSFYKLECLSLTEKWQLVDVFTRYLIEEPMKVVPVKVAKINKLNDEMQEIENERIGNLMSHLDIVAMTTTGACKYRKQLEVAGAQIVLVEEAAEVLEAQIVTSMSPDTKQLILIGDHLQLRPKVTSFELAEEYGLSISLFERLVHLGVPNVVLQKQRRMRPEISRVVRLIYPGLQDHASVTQFEDVR